MDIKDCKKGYHWCPIEKKCVPTEDKKQGKGQQFGQGKGPIGIPKKKIKESLNSLFEIAASGINSAASSASYATAGMARVPLQRIKPRNKSFVKPRSKSNKRKEWLKQMNQQAAGTRRNAKKEALLKKK